MNYWGTETLREYRKAARAGALDLLWLNCRWPGRTPNYGECGERKKFRVTIFD